MAGTLRKVETFTGGTEGVGLMLAPQVGLEPTTLRLTAGCSAIELLRSNLQDNGSL